MHILQPYTWAQFGGGHGRVPPLFQTEGGHKMPCPPTFFSIGFVFGEVPKIKVMFVTSCVKLNVRSHTGKLMLTLETMGVGKGGGRGEALPSWFLKLLAKKVVFSISKGKNQISPRLAPPGKNFGKIPYWSPPGKNPSDAHGWNIVWRGITDSVSLYILASIK